MSPLGVSEAYSPFNCCWSALTEAPNYFEAHWSAQTFRALARDVSGRRPKLNEVNGIHMQSAAFDRTAFLRSSVPSPFQDGFDKKFGGSYWNILRQLTQYLLFWILSLDVVCLCMHVSAKWFFLAGGRSPSNKTHQPRTQCLVGFIGQQQKWWIVWLKIITLPS